MVFVTASEADAPTVIPAQGRSNTGLNGFTNARLVPKTSRFIHLGHSRNTA
jgi:hypothetical protein